MTKTLLLTLTFSISVLFSIGQDDNWDVYMAQYDQGPGSVLLDMSLKKRAPVATLPFIVIFGLTIDNCGPNGLPSKESFEVFYKASDSSMPAITNGRIFQHAGTFTYQCERLDYVYVGDTTNIRHNLEAIYKKYFHGYKYHINIKVDKEWEAYLTFLYPNENIQEYMANQKVLMQLQGAGDNLTKTRPVDHWLYFKTESDRECFIAYANQQKFKVTQKEYNNKFEFPYSLQISRVDPVQLDKISALTLELRNQAAKCRGNYDGWECVVVK